MPSESQHKLTSFIRNNLTFKMKKSGPTIDPLNEAPSSTAGGKASMGVTLPEAEIEIRTLVQGHKPTGSDFPNPAHPSSSSMHPRVATFPNLPVEHAIMASSRQVKRCKEKGASDDHRSLSHSLRRVSHGLPATEASDTDKIKSMGEKPNLSGVDILAEFERLKKEVEALKKTVHEQKKVIKKQSKRNEELKGEVVANLAVLAERDLELSAKDEQLQKMKDNFGKAESCISSFETMFQCQVCIELLRRPYALSPCGHVFCLQCLQEWFRKAPAGDYDEIEDLDDPRYILRRPKSCPCCRAKITHRPIPLFVLRGATRLLHTSKAQLLGIDHRPDSPIDDNDGDPWKGMFPTGDDDEESASDGDDESSQSAGADSLVESDGRISDHFTHYSDDLGPYGFGSGGESDNAPYSDDYESDDEDIYVNRRWQPATRIVGSSGVGGASEEDDRRTLSLLRRGCPLQMILSFHMTYTREEGIIAYVPSLNPSLIFDDGIVEIEMMHRVFLGWNIDVDEEVDGYGCIFMQRILNELEEFPERWNLHPRISGPNIEVFDALRLAKLSEVEEYDSDLASYLEGVEVD